MTQRQLDTYIPPLQRYRLQKQIHDFSNRHPALFYFLLLQLILVGPPLLIFLFFSGSVLLTSMTICITVALTTALTVTAVCVGAALLVLVPTLIVAATNATVLFVVLATGWWLLKKFAESGTPVPFGEGLLRRVRESRDPASGIQEGVQEGAKQLQAGVQDGSKQLQEVAEMVKADADEAFNANATPGWGRIDADGAKTSSTLFGILNGPGDGIEMAPIEKLEEARKEFAEKLDAEGRVAAVQIPTTINGVA